MAKAPLKDDSTTVPKEPSAELGRAELKKIRNMLAEQMPTKPGQLQQLLIDMYSRE